MKICIPIAEDHGAESLVYGHFGSAPMFYLADTESGEERVMENGNLHHGHGMCRPVAALQGQDVDAVVVGGIGGGALAKLNAMGVRVYLAQHRTVGETLDAAKQGTLPPVGPRGACGGHGHGGGCGHDGHGSR
jgi:predicted Fe-Mo cluster-binding NifX family protein